MTTAIRVANLITYAIEQALVNEDMVARLTPNDYHPDYHRGYQHGLERALKIAHGVSYGQEVEITSACE